MNDEKIYFNLGERRIWLYLWQVREILDDITAGGVTNPSGSVLELFISANGEEDAKKAQEQFDREQHKIDQSIE